MNENRSDGDRITYFAATHTRGKHRAFGIKAKDRDKHMYVIGRSGMGKSTMLENMAIQDIQNGEGMAFIDPHGSSAEKLLDFVPEERIDDVMYLAPFDTEYPVGFNIMEDIGYDQRHKVVAGLMGTFERIWADAWSSRMQYILQNTLLALLEYPGSTIIDVNRMLVNKAFRADVIKHISDPVVASFWKEEFANYTDTYTKEATPAIQNKIGQFVSNPLVRNIVGQPVSSFDVRKIMDKKKILIINLSKGRMGEANAALLGSMLVIKIYLSALSRAEEPAVVQKGLPPFYFYVDEFQSVVNDAFEGILSEARKYKLGLIIAHQYIEQMSETVRGAVFGNVGTTAMFRVGPIDAEFLKTVFEPTFYTDDMVNLGLGEIYLTLMIDGVGSQPFSAQTLPPIEAPHKSFRDEIVQHTRKTYGRRRESVEEAVRSLNDKWHEAAQQKHKIDSAAGQNKGGARFGNRQGGYGANQSSHSRPAPRQTQTQRAPADVLRATQKKETVAHQRPQKVSPNSRNKKHDAPKDYPQKDAPPEKSALKDAIKTAMQKGAEEGSRPSPTPNPAPKPVSQPVQDQQNTHEKKRPTPNSNRHTQEKNPPREDIDPEMLKRILNGD